MFAWGLAAAVLCSTMLLSAGLAPEIVSTGNALTVLIDDGADVVIQVRGSTGTPISLRDLATRVAALEGEKSEMSQRIDALAGRLDAAAANATALAARLSDAESRIHLLEPRVNETESSLLQAELDIGVIGRAVTVLNETDLAALSTSVTALADTASARRLGEKCNPADSCLQLLLAACPEEGPAVSGVYWLWDSTRSVRYQAYCDMTTAGGGWEIVWKNSGGHNKPVAGISNRRLRRGEGRATPVMPDTEEDPLTHGSAMSPFWEERAEQPHTHWIKVLSLYNASWALDRRQHIRVDFGRSTLAEVFALPPNEFCHNATDLISVFVNDNYEGSTRFINSYQSGSQTFGLATSGNGGADNCDQGQDDLINVGSAFYRLDAPDAGDNTIRHLFSYVDGTSTPRDFSRCAYCCWSGATTAPCGGYHEVFWWGYRPAVGLGTAALPAQSCEEIRVSPYNVGNGIYYVRNTISGESHAVFCDMETAGGGWEIVWKNIAGDAGTLLDEAIPNAALRTAIDGLGVRDPLRPVVEDFTHTHRSGTSQNFGMHAARPGLEWLRVSLVFGDNEFKTKQMLRVDFGDSLDLNDVFASSTQGCSTLAAPVSVSFNGGAVSSTDQLFKSSDLSSVGLAGSRTEACGQPTTNRLADNADAWSTSDGHTGYVDVRNLFSTADSLLGPDNSGSCLFCCDDCGAGTYEAFYWAVRPRQTQQ